MKKIIAIALALLMVFSLVACGSNNSNDTGELSESENSAGQEIIADNAQTEPSGNEATEPAGNETAETAELAEHPVLKLCGLTVEDIEAGLTTLGDSSMETESAFLGVMACSELSFDNFEKWVNALAENCKKASADGKLYESEMSAEEITSFSLDPNALMNVVQFIYRTSGKVIYVTLSYAITGSAFSCKLEVY